MNKISLKTARVNNGFSQYKLADILGVTQRTVTGWETGENAIKQHYVYALAYIYGIDHRSLALPDTNK